MADGEMDSSTRSLALLEKRVLAQKPRNFSYDRIPQNINPTLSRGSLRSTTLPKTLRENVSSRLLSAEASNPVVTEDRYVTTSYTDSLDRIFKATPSFENRRLSVLQEEKSRPVSRAFDENNEPALPISNMDALPEYPPSSMSQNEDFLQQVVNSQLYQTNPDSIRFIAYESKDLVYDDKKKMGKVVGRYMLGSMLGEGSYGKVKEGYCIETLRRVAVKIMKHRKLRKIPNGEENVKREITLLKVLHHENIVQLLDVIYNAEKQKMYMVFEYCATTLQDILNRAHENRLPESQCQRYFRQLISGLQYLHSNSVIHRDLKPGNLLVTIGDVVKISDFGVAAELSRYQEDDKLMTSSGSPAFQPPEVAMGCKEFSGFKVDIWAAGVVLYNMLSGKYPFDGETIYELFDNIAKKDYEMPEEITNPVLTALIRGLLTKAPEDRFTLEQIVQHIWLKAELIQADDEISVVPSYRDDSSFTSRSSLSLRMSNKRGSKSHLNNPNFPNDTTLVPFLENMFPDLREVTRRTSCARSGSQSIAIKKRNIKSASDGCALM